MGLWHCFRWVQRVLDSVLGCRVVVLMKEYGSLGYVE